MDALVLPLADRAAVLAVVGGKGAALARAARAGLPVPPGFHVTTAAYRSYPLPAVPTPADFTAPLPDGPASAIRAAYVELGEPAVAVRSSATAEDLPGLSFAGQQETYLNVRGADALLDAVRRCWASLWDERAVVYRARVGVARVEIAVVVQQLVPADAAGVLFTADPVTGDATRMVVDAAWGLGEAVVGGAVTPDSVVADAATGAVRERRTGDKGTMTVPRAGSTSSGTEDRPVPADRRHAPVLDDGQVAELVGLGRRVARLYGGPTDVEWALRDGTFALLQARPITSATDPWNDSRGRDDLWTNTNLGEALPGTPTPLTWCLMQIFSAHAMTTSALPGFEAFGRIGGRPYLNLSRASAIAGAVGIPRGVFRGLVGSAFGRIPAGVDVPRPRLDRRALFRVLLPAVRGMVGIARRERPRVAAYLADNPGRCDALVARIADLDAAGLAALWVDELRPLLERASDMLQVAGRSDPQALLGARWLVEKLAGPADAADLTTGADLASMGPVVGSVEVARGRLSPEEYRRRWGHRGPDEFEVAAPPPEPPVPVADAAALLDARRTAREEAWARLPARRAPLVRRAVRSWNAAAEAREGARSEVVRVFAVLRAWAARAEAVLGLPVAFLELDEVLAALGGVPDLAERAAVRRETHARYAALPPYPSFIRGSFDPFAWAADPHRRGDVWVRGAQPPARTGAITGFAGAAGVVEGTVRVLTSVADGAALRRGEILVTTVTNVGWTPLFPLAAAVVTDVGAPLSHAAIVARELGIPAVVGCGDATMRLRTGDRVRVDGSAGTVEPLPR